MPSIQTISTIDREKPGYCAEGMARLRSFFLLSQIIKSALNFKQHSTLAIMILSEGSIKLAGL